MYYQNQNWSHSSSFEKAKQNHVLTSRTGAHCIPVRCADHRSDGCGGREGGGHGGDGGGDPVVQPPALPLVPLFNPLVFGRATLHRLDVCQWVCLTKRHDGSLLLLTGFHGLCLWGDIAEGGGCEDCGRGRARNEEKLRLAWPTEEKSQTMH